MHNSVMELPPHLNAFAKLTDAESCWCGSGKSYETCHKGRAEQRRAEPKEALNLLAKQFKSKVGCLHPNAPSGCAGKIIDAHTIQKSGPLRSIAKNGEVYSLRGAINSLVENNGKLIPQKRGIATVSTFPGFCAKHDNEFFEPIENGVFEINNSNCFLFHYRNVCSEFHAKLSMQFGKAVLDTIDRGRDVLAQLDAQQIAADMNFGASLAQQELADDRATLTKIWKSNDFSNLSFYFIEFERQLPFVTSFSATPKFSLSGAHIQDWSEEVLRKVSVSSVNLGGRSGLIFSSLDHDLMTALSGDLGDNRVGTPSNLLRWVMANAENVAFEIEWWDRLSDRRRRHLLDLSMIGLPFGGPDDELETYKAAVEVLPLTGVTRSFRF